MKVVDKESVIFKGIGAIKKKSSVLLQDIRKDALRTS
jgi:hypothetical protein